MPTALRTRKITLMGFRSVGKSSLTVQFVEGKFLDSYNPTIEHTFTKAVTHSGNRYTLRVVDTAGQDESNVLPESHVMNVDGYILVYSVNSQKSFEIVKLIRDKILDRTCNANIPIVLVGNKSDLSEERVVSHADGERLAAEWRVPFCESTAKQNADAQEVFDAILAQIERTYNGELFNPGASGEQQPSRCTIS